MIRAILPSMLLASLLATSAAAQPIAVTNAGFEDVTGLTNFNEFHFGIPAGWNLYDPSSIEPDAGTYIGTLTNPSVAFFSEPAPQGSRVLILYNAGMQGAGAYGVQQTTAEVIQEGRSYTLTVEVGDIDSGTALNSTFFNLEGFPGYRIELLADPVPASVGEEIVLASDSTSLTGVLVEGFFEPAQVTFGVTSGHPQIGQLLAIRLISLNQNTGLLPVPDNEVDFDAVSLTSSTMSSVTDWWMMD